MSTADLDRSRALYGLHQEEKRQEERTRKILDDLTSNSKEMATARMRLVEKLLDVTVKDEISRKVNEGRTALDSASTQLTDQFIKENARAVIEAQVQANMKAHQIVAPESPFVSALDRLVHTSEEAARAEVKDAVSQYVKPHIDAALTAKHRANNTNNVLQGVAAAVATARKQHHRDIGDTIGYRARSDAGDRRRRVAEALKMLKKDIGDLAPLLYVTPVEHKTDIGKKEAEIIAYRKKFASLCADGDKLLQERRVQESLIAAEEDRLRAEADKACQQLVVLQRELETRQMDLREIREAAAPKSGEWASNTLRIEGELSRALEEERMLRSAAEAARKDNDMLRAECALLKDEVAAGVEELGAMAAELKEVEAQLEERVSGDKARLFALRAQQVADTRQINELRHRMLHRREDVRRQKREDRTVINTILAQVGVERELQSVISAVSIELQRRAEMLHIQTDHHIKSLSEKRQSVDAAIRNMNETIRQLAIKIANYQAAVEYITRSGKGTKLTAAQQMHYLERLIAQWEREEADAAAVVAETAARVDLNTRQNDYIIRQIAELMVLQEDVRAEGVDITRSTDDDLQFVRSNLYSEVSQRRYQESKYDQTLFLFKERVKARDEGRPVMPLTRNRRIPLAERRARRIALNRAKKEGQAALQHIRSGSYYYNNNNNNNGSISMSNSRLFGGSTAAGAGGSSLNTSAAAVHEDGLNDDAVANGSHIDPQPDAFRMMVIQFIKNEIQPLYDSAQITKRRFVDVVSRVSSWFVGTTHRPKTELTEADVTMLTRKIQETLTWQDEQRVKQRSISHASSASGVGL